MSIPGSLSVYRNFDDDALAALASTGLLRRAAKDVEGGKVAWEAGTEPRQGQVRADGQLVTLGPEGPAKARCDCPAPGVCKHILAATLWLRALPEEGRTEGADASPVAEADPLAELCAIDPAALFKSAGVAAARKAAALARSAGPVGLNVQGTVLLIEAPELGLVCRFIAGGGFAGMVSETPAASRTAVHLLAVVLAWQAQARPFDWPASVTVDAVAERPEGLREQDRQFLARLRAVVLEVTAGGWSHVSAAMPAQLRAFALSARVEALPRVAGMMRSLAGTAELLARRDAGADERQAIALAARVHALCEALCNARGAVLDELRGRERRQFSGGAELALLPLGAHWWEQPGGARGLTVSFWDHDSGALVQAVLARRDALDAAFHRRSAWSTHALWPGVGPASTLGACSLALRDARLSVDNRLGIGGETRATAGAPLLAADPRWQAAGVDEWSALPAAVRAGVGLRAAGGAAGDAYLLLKPAAHEAPLLDEAAQLLTWTVRDRHGQALVLRLPCSASYHARIANLEAWATHGTPIRGVLVRVERALRGGILEPVTLLVEARRAITSVSLDYEAPPASLRMALTNRLLRLLRAEGRAAPWSAPPAHLRPVQALLVILENKAMTGRLHVLAEQAGELAAIGGNLRAVGLETVADALERYLASPGAGTALSLVYLCQTCLELDTGFVFR